MPYNFFTPPILLALFHIPINNSIVSDYFLCLSCADMAANIPSFVKRSTKYEDVFGEASGSQAPISAKPVSQLPTPSLEQKKASSGARKRDSSADARSNKKPKLALARSSPSSSSSQKTQLFQRMLSDQIPEATIREGDRLSLTEAAKDKVVANAKSFFLDLKISEQVADTARIDEGLRADLRQVKADLASAVKERDAYQKENLKFKEVETRALQEKRKEDMLRKGLEEEVDGLWR